MHETYADYELSKLSGEGARIKFWGEQGGETRWISITPETLELVAEILRRAPESSWGV